MAPSAREVKIIAGCISDCRLRHCASQQATLDSIPGREWRSLLDQFRVWGHSLDGGLRPTQPQGLLKTMMEQLQVILDFACYHCQNSVGVTLHCEGKGLSAGMRTVAAVNVPCPHCHAVNQLYFEPSGRVHAVSPCPGPRPLPEPSLN